MTTKIVSFSVDMLDPSDARRTDQPTIDGHLNFGETLRSDMPKTCAEILAVAAQCGLTDGKVSALPTWEGPFMTGKRLNANAYVNGREKFMMRRTFIETPAMAKTVRVFVQLALLAREDHTDVLRRAVSALAIAHKLAAMGRKVEVVACWASEPMNHTDTIVLGWKVIENATIETLARLTAPTMFRSFVMWARRPEGPLRAKDPSFPNCGDAGGYCRTVGESETFRNALSAGGLLEPGDVVPRWELGPVGAVEAAMNEYDF